MSGVKITAGEYNIKQMAERFDQKAFIDAALDNDMQFLKDRRSIALFSATIENAQHIAEGMRARGIDCEVIDGDMDVDERNDKFTAFRTGKLRAITSVGVLTTGTDLPCMDAVVLFRATKSPGLYQQIIGRGFRVVYADGYDLNTKEGRIEAIRNGPKPNFLTLDHGGNIERHGPITCVQKPQKREKGERTKTEKANGRVCEICRTGWPLEVIICGLCGHEMVKQRDATASLEVEASNADIMGTPFSRGESSQWFPVEDVRYFRHKKVGNPDSLLVTYYCGIMLFNEWVHFDRPGALKQAALSWWGKRNSEIIPDNVTEALLNSGKLRKPDRILVKKEQKFFKVLHHVFEPVAEERINQTA